MRNIQQTSLCLHKAIIHVLSKKLSRNILYTLSLWTYYEMYAYAEVTDNVDLNK